jgi:DNA-binding NtrC family response regulator
MELLLLHDWPGNVRQLQNELRRIVANVDADAVITPRCLSSDIRRGVERTPPRHAPDGREIAVPLTEKLVPTLSRIESEMIRVALHNHHGRVEAAAKALGISRKGLYLKRQRLGL